MFGEKGTSEGKFNYPHGIALFEDKIYIADTHNHRIQIFSTRGHLMKSIGSCGSIKGKFNYPNSVAVDSQGRVIVADTFNNRIQICWKIHFALDNVDQSLL